MLKLRLKRMGRKSLPFYRLVIMENKVKRSGRTVEEVGYYNPITKDYLFDNKKIKTWLKIGAQPTPTVFNLLKKSNII